jgi:hypothetical protein
MVERRELIINDKAVSKMQTAVINFYLSSIPTSFAIKLDRIREDFSDNPAGGQFEMRSATILDELRKNKDILDWFPVKKDSRLDEMQVDKVIALRADLLIPLQNAGRENKAVHKRDLIGRKYGVESSQIIPVLAHRNLRGKMYSEKDTKLMILEIIKQTIPINLNGQNSTGNDRMGS